MRNIPGVWGLAPITTKQPLVHSFTQLNQSVDSATHAGPKQLLGVWIALTEASKHIPSDQRISPVKVLRLFSQLISRVSNVSKLKLSVSQELSQCVLEDETNRKSSKNSDDYPSKKKKPPTGDPNTKPIASELLNRAIQRLF
jgi:hypothetical protein